MKLEFGEDNLEGAAHQEQDEERTFLLIEEALLSKDLNRACAILEQIENHQKLNSPALVELQGKIQKAKSQVEMIEKLYFDGARALEKDDHEQAIACFHEVLKLCPDHAEARAGLQGASRHQEWRNTINQLLDRAHDFRCRGNHESARDQCREVLRIAPDNDSASLLLSEINHWINSRRRVRRIIEQGDLLFREKKFEQAIAVWDQIKYLDSSFEDGLELIAKARRAIRSENQEKLASELLRDAQRAYDNRQYSYCLKLLAPFPEESSLFVDAQVCRRKAENAIDNENIAKDLALKIRKLILDGEKENATVLFEMLLQVDPVNGCVDEIRELLQNC